MTSMTEDEMVSRGLHVLYNVASGMHCTATSDTKCIRCLLDTNKYSKRTKNVRRMNNVWKDKT